MSDCGPEEEGPPMSHEDIEAIGGMNDGDFSPITALLRSGRELHREVRLLLAEFLCDGNSRGRLTFVRSNRRPTSDDKNLIRMADAYYAVQECLASHPDMGVTDAF